MPVNVSIREVTNTSVRVLWHRPEKPNGVIQGYRMYFMHQNFTDVRTVRDPQQKMDYHLTGLSKFSPLQTCHVAKVTQLNLKPLHRALHQVQDLAEGFHLEE